MCGGMVVDGIKVPMPFLNGNITGAALRRPDPRNFKDQWKCEESLEFLAFWAHDLLSRCIMTHSREEATMFCTLNEWRVNLRSLQDVEHIVADFFELRRVKVNHSRRQSEPVRQAVRAQIHIDDTQALLLRQQALVRELQIVNEGLTQKAIEESVGYAHTEFPTQYGHNYPSSSS
jgi:hypothetical protein